MSTELVHPRLIGVGGPIEGQTFALTGAVCVIGRQAGCDVQILDVTVSRRHCELRRATGGDDALEGDAGQPAEVVIRDLDSRSGTFVNGRPLGRRALVNGDLIQVGSSAFLFAGAAVDERVPGVGDSGLIGGSTIVRSLGDSRYLAPDSAPTEGPGRVAAALRALLALCTEAHRARAVDAVAETALVHALAAIPADRACVLLGETGAGLADLGATPPSVESLRCAAVALRGVTEPAPFALSQTLVGRALTERVALLSADVEADTGDHQPASLDRAQVRSLLCAPLAIPESANASTEDGAAPAPDREDGPPPERVLGALYLDAARPGALTEAHLELAVAIASIVALALENALYLDWLRSENRRLRADGEATAELLGESAAMERLRGLVERVGPTDATVLIRGESGTGKELCARALHRASRRADGPFVALNCAVLSETLLESELFGHERGAFTGAVARKPGKLELAAGGTLFLDEVGEIPVDLQAKLLRVLQEREFERVGGTRPIRVDVRVVAATNRDLEAAIRAGSFRDDLYYRLNVITLAMPALRERHGDVLLLARHFARLHATRAGRRVVGIDPAARDALTAYDWPGNVRQLGNAIERALVLGSDDVIRLEDLPDELLAARPSALAGDPAGPGQTFQDRIVATKKALICDAYERAGGDHQEAARLLGVHANSLHRLIRNLGLKPALGK